MTKAGEPMVWLESHAEYAGDECLTWPFSRRGDGYGYCWQGTSKRHRAHRLMCELSHGPAPEGHCEAAHSCGNGHLGCVNPNHLSWKTPKQNQADRLVHGTHSRGERQGRSKLTSDIVLKMRAEYRPRLNSFAKVALKYGISTSTAERAITGQAWAHLEAKG